MISLASNGFGFDQLKKCVQELYIHSMRNSNTNTNQTCLTIEIKDFIEFSYKLDADTFLPIWAQKQRDIVSSIVIDTDQIEQPIKYLVGLDISFVESNDKAVASMVIVDNENLNIMAKISVNCNIIH